MLATQAQQAGQHVKGEREKQQTAAVLGGFCQSSRRYTAWKAPCTCGVLLVQESDYHICDMEVPFLLFAPLKIVVLLLVFF